MRHTMPLLLLLGGLLAFSGCSGPSGRLMTDEEDDYVGARTAGQETWDRLVEGSVGKLLNRVVASNQGLAKTRVAFVGLENKSSEALGDWRDQLIATIATAINTSERFTMVSDRYVSAGLREARVNRDDLFLPKNQRAFAAALEQAGNPVEALLFASIQSGTTRGGGDVRQVKYSLTLELVDLATGEPVMEKVDIRKAYTK